MDNVSLGVASECLVLCSLIGPGCCFVVHTSRATAVPLRQSAWQHFGGSTGTCYRTCLLCRRLRPQDGEGLEVREHHSKSDNHQLWQLLLPSMWRRQPPPTHSSSGDDCLGLLSQISSRLPPSFLAALVQGARSRTFLSTPHARGQQARPAPQTGWPFNMLSRAWRPPSQSAEAP